MSFLSEYKKVGQKIGILGPKRKSSFNDVLIKKWEWLVLCLIIFNLIIFVGSIFVIYKISEDNLFFNGDFIDEQILPVDKNKLGDSVEYIREKEIRSAEIREGSFNIIDPSL